MDPSLGSLKSDSLAQSKRPFKVYRKAKKEVWNNIELQILMKKHIKDLQSLECYQLLIDPLSWEDPSSIDRNKLRSLTKIMRTSKSPAVLKFPLQSPGPFHLNSFLPHLKHHLNSLSTFKLDFTHSAFLTPEGCKSLMLYLKKLKKISNLDCRLYDAILNPHEAFSSFRSLVLLKHLSSLSLNFSSQEMHSVLSFFSRYLSQLPSLTSLSIDLSYCYGITPTGFFRLFSCLSKLENLEALKLETKGLQDLQPSVIVELFKGLKDLPHFQDLTLDLSGCMFSDSIATSVALLNPSRIRRLSLGLYQDLSDSEMAEFLVVLQRFSGLTHLALLLDQICLIEGQGFKDFPKTVACFQGLAHLYLKLSQRIDPKMVFGALSQSFENLKELISLKINSEGHLSVDVSAIQGFCQSLPRLSKLKYLHFNFALCHYWTDKCVEKIAVALKGLPHLVDVHLNFGNGESGNQGIEALTKSLGGLKSLRRLELLFSYCRKINWESFEIVTECLKSLNELEEVSLTMCPLSPMNFLEEYKNLVDVLERIEKLTKASLELLKTDDGVGCDLLVENAKKSPKNIIINWSSFY